MKAAPKIIIVCILPALIFAACKKSESNCAYCTESEPVGYMVGTMCSDDDTKPQNQVAVIFKTLNNAAAPIGNNWNDPSAGANRVQRIFPTGWTSDKIGQVFGIALDHNGGIYLSATDVYQMDGLMSFVYNNGVKWASGSGPAGPAGIYYTNYNTVNTTMALVTTLSSSNASTVGTNQIPNTGFATTVGNGVGNIAYDYKNNQLFATNLEDGKIYRIDPASGKVKSTLDPFIADDQQPGIAPVGEQLWGIGVYTTNGVTKVYFALSTLPHITNSFAAGGVEIWSVALTVTGEFDAATSGGNIFTATATSGFIKKEVSVSGTQTKVTDIAFSNAGKMLVAERGNPHAAGVFEYAYSGSGWAAANSFYVGGGSLGAIGSGGNPTGYLSGKNAAGGVDYSEREQGPGNFLYSDIVWATGNYMPTKTLVGPYPNFVYGAQGMNSSGNSALLPTNAQNDLYIDYNCTGWPHIFDANSSVKNKIGDVEFFDRRCIASPKN